MEIRIDKKDYVLSICIGRKTQWFKQSYYITITKEYYKKSEVVWADLIYRFFKIGE